ncbi:threonine ammonia-lyase IlvA [Flavobacterium indicum]|uniref:threonine ammonia-lyase IlvA n=1 Tax=Flavobacterium indicum TaxID=312277 RepID=UPI000A00B52F|nr:threonine ammonia-lyase IlvA [Flavobacterium indicum]
MESWSSRTHPTSPTVVALEGFKEAQHRLAAVLQPTPLQLNLNLSAHYKASVYLKREDLQLVRSYKIRGAYNKMATLSTEECQRGIVCASAGNHAQGVAYSCHLLGIVGKIVMPKTTPKQKIKQVQLFGKEWIDIILAGDTFDDAFQEAQRIQKEQQLVFVHPFDDPKVIEGQGTTALEILSQSVVPIDYVFLPIGGGGLAAGIASVFQVLSPKTKLIGVEPQGAPSMTQALQAKGPVRVAQIDKFVDGAAVQQVGRLNYEICQDKLSDVVLVPEGKVCSTILKLYNEEALVVEPAGALSIAALDFYQEEIQGKTIVCVVSGSNNDIERTEEIKERSLLYEGLKHYFIIQFPQRPGALKAFVNQVLGEEDDISYFQFIKKNNREIGPVVVGLEMKKPSDLEPLMHNMNQLGFAYQYLNEKEALLRLLI